MREEALAEDLRRGLADLDVVACCEGREGRCLYCVFFSELDVRDAAACAGLVDGG